MARGYYGRSGDDGMDIARNAMDLSEGLGGLLEKGQQIERGRRELADDAGIRRAYDHIASRVGQGGDISALDGDPVMNSRYGVMAMGRFMADRAGSERSRLSMLQNMAKADDTLYQQIFRPLAMTAMEAYQRGDMNTFGQAASQLSRVSPFPYQYRIGDDGSFVESFRSSKEGKFIDTGDRLSPQQVFEAIRSIMSGEQKVLRGADMQAHAVNPNFLASAARYKMSTIMDNAAALQDPSRWIPLEKNGHVVYAIPQNRHDDYSAAPSYRVLDEVSGRSYMAGSMDELLNQGYVPSAVKATSRVLQRKGRSEGIAAVGPDGSTRITQAQYEKLVKAADTYAVFEDPVTGEKSTSPMMRSGLVSLAVRGGYGTIDNAMMVVDRVEAALVNQYPDKMRGLNARQRKEAAMAYLLNGEGDRQEHAAQQGNESSGFSIGHDDPLSRSIRRNTGAGSAASHTAKKNTGGTGQNWRDLTPEELANLPPEERDRMLSDTSVHKVFKGIGDFLTYPARQANRE